MNTNVTFSYPVGYRIWQNLSIKLYIKHAKIILLRLYVIFENIQNSRQCCSPAVNRLIFFTWTSSVSCVSLNWNFCYTVKSVDSNMPFCSLLPTDNVYKIRPSPFDKDIEVIKEILNVIYTQQIQCTFKHVKITEKWDILTSLPGILKQMKTQDRKKIPFGYNSCFVNPQKGLKLIKVLRYSFLITH